MSLYHEAAGFFQSSPGEGGSLKARVFRRRDLKSPPNQLYALVLETCKWSGVLKEVIERAELLKHERKLSPALSLLLVHDFLLSKGGIALPQSHGLRQSIERHKGRLNSELTLAKLRRKAPAMDALREQIERASAGEEANYPRWVRVNALKSSIEEQLETTFRAFARASTLEDVISKAAKSVYIDPHVPGLLAITQGTDLTKSEAYTSGKIILQDKASCFPAYLLDPQAEDGDVIDACAAPGNKTTHLAAIMHTHRPEFESPPQSIFAFEKDTKRAQTLEKMIRIAGSKNTTRIGFGQNFLQVDPHAEKYKNVGGLLLDPSCSGSGIVGRDSMPELHLPEAPDSNGKKSGQPKSNSHQNSKKRKHGQVDPEPSKNILRDDEGNETVVQSEKDLQARLDALSSFQLSILLHAFEFPGAAKVTYSTCSVHAEENEHVVVKALESEVARRRGWRILKRESQVRGMREWEVRGKLEYCKGDADVAEGCIRAHKADGRGVMGFFVAGFVRTRAGGDGGDGGGDGSLTTKECPYLMDGEGHILRDMLGMPILQSTGAPVALEAKEDDTIKADSASADAIDQSTTSASSPTSESEDDDDDWEGFGD